MGEEKPENASPTASPEHAIGVEAEDAAVVARQTVDRLRGNRKFRRGEAVKAAVKERHGGKNVPSGHAHTDVKISLSGALDLIDNPVETRNQLARLMRFRAPSNTSLFVDISGVTFIEPVALVYFVAQLDRLRTAGINLSGNYPRTFGPLRVLVDAGFEDFMRIVRQIPLPESGGPKVKLTSGEVTELLDPGFWLPLYDFMKDDPSITPDVADELYNAFAEMIENVRQHAYSQRLVGHKWYGVALRGDASQPGRIVVVDLGKGIPKSLEGMAESDFLVLFGAILRSVLGEANRWFQLIEGEESLPTTDLLACIQTDEWTRVWAATQGFRNRTKGSGRGTGLSGLRRTVEKAQASALHVMAGTACVSYVAGRKPRHVCLPTLRGTAVCLDIGGMPPNIVEERS